MKKSFGGIKTYQAIILISFAVLGIAIGSFYDLPIAEKFFIADNLFGKVFDAVGSLPAYALIGASGVLLYFYFIGSGSKKRDYLAYAFLIVVPLFSGALWGYDVLTDFISKTLYAVAGGVVIVAVLDTGFFFFAKNCDRIDAYKDAITILISAFLVIAIAFVLKKAVVRPRYLFLVANGVSYYQPWYDFSSTLKATFSGAEYSSLLDSWPSGHATMAGFGVLFVLVAKLNKKTAGKETFFFFVSLVWIVLVALARMSDGHHFLSDVSWAVLIGSGFSVLDAILIFEGRPEMERAILENTHRLQDKGNSRAWQWNEWRLHKAQNRQSVLADNRELLAARKANNSHKEVSHSPRLSLKLSQSKKSAKPDQKPFLGDFEK